MTRNLEIIIGTYEEFLLGYTWNEKKNTLSHSFADKAHARAIKCLAVGGKLIASGGADDQVVIYDMESRKQSQIFLSHEGSVNTIAFTPDMTHILSGGDDGRMIAVRLNTWQVEATWKKAHKGLPVTHVNCHPSGKLALSIGKDRVLRTWNLIKGRVAYKTNLKSRSSLGLLPDCLAWAPSGDYFTIAGPRVLEIWSIKKADVWRSEKTSSKPICIAWITESSAVVGLEDGKIIWLFVNQNVQSISFDAHQSRVKAICFQHDILATASSSGQIKLWHVDSKAKTISELAVTNIGCRPTCIGILDLDQFGPEYKLFKDRSNEKKGIASIKSNSVIPTEKGVVVVEYDENSKSEASDEESSTDNEESTSDDANEIVETESLTKSKKRKSNSEWTVTKVQKIDKKEVCTKNVQKLKVNRKK